MSIKVSQIKVYTNGAWQDITKVHDGSGFKNFRGVWSNGNWYELGKYWKKLASGMTILDMGTPALTNLLNSTDCVFVDSYNKRLYHFTYSNGNFDSQENSLFSNIGIPALASLSDSDIAMIDTSVGLQKLHIITDWKFELEGNILSIPTPNRPAITELDGSTVVIVDSYNNNMKTYYFDGTDWAQTGNTFNFTVSISISDITTLNSTTIAFIDNANDELRTYSWNGTDWSKVGNSLSIANVGNLAIGTLSSSRVALYTDGDDLLRTYNWDGTNWSQVGDSLNVTTTNSVAICGLSATEIAFAISDDDTIYPYKFMGT